MVDNQSTEEVEVGLFLAMLATHENWPRVSCQTWLVSAPMQSQSVRGLKGCRICRPTETRPTPGCMLWDVSTDLSVYMCNLQLFLQLWADSKYSFSSCLMPDAVPSPAQVVTRVSKAPTPKINTLRVDWNLFRIQLRENESQISYSRSPGE